MSAQTFAKWTPLPPHHVDCEALRLSQFAQSAATKNGTVPAFRLLNIVRAGSEKPRLRVTVPQPMSEPVPNCPQEDAPWRERAWTPEQMERNDEELK
jgi:hypothetical protein